MSLKSPLARARGGGSAKAGFEHWWGQRISAAALIPLTLWFLWSAAVVDFAAFESARAWFANLYNAAFGILLVLSLGYHSHLGVQVVVEDYVHGPLKVASLVVAQFAHGAAVTLAVLAILRIAMGV